LGVYPSTSLSEARELAQAARKLALRGDNPQHAVRPPSSPVGIQIAAAISRWLETKAGNRSVGLERRRMELHVLATLGTAGVAAVSRAELSNLLHDMAFGDDPKPVEANRTYTSLRGFFRWCRQSGFRQDDPTELLSKPVKEEPSARRRREETEPLLEMHELARLWTVAAQLNSSVLGDLLRCLLLLPLRREELTGLAWKEVKDAYVGDGWQGAALTIPASRMKGRRPAVVPLSGATIGILEGRRRITGSGPFVFSVSGRDAPFNGWRRGSDTIRTALGERTDWSVHTIRKSVATALVRELGAEELLVGRLLQHSARSVLGVTAVYQRSSRLAEQASLLERWAEHLQAVAERLDTSASVVALRPLSTMASQ
jgi:integrase